MVVQRSDDDNGSGGPVTAAPLRPNYAPALGGQEILETTTILSGSGELSWPGEW